MKDDVYETLEDIDISAVYTAFLITATNLSEPSPFTEEYPEEYNRVSAFGEEGVPYVIEYVREAPINVLNACFFVCCCYEILGLEAWLVDKPLENVDEHLDALETYILENQ